MKSKKLVVISGGTKGMGFSFCHKFAKEGFNIATCSRSESELLRLKAELESAYDVICHTSKVDLKDSKELKLWGGSVLKDMGGCDLLINNAAVYTPGNILSETEGYLEDILRINLLAPYELCRIFVPGMVIKGQGHVFNISSIASLKAVDSGGAYAISKHAMTGLSKTLRQELIQTGVKVTTVYPGSTFTASWDGTDIDPNRLIDPKDIAEAIWSAWSLSSRTVVEEIVIRPVLGDL